MRAPEGMEKITALWAALRALHAFCGSATEGFSALFCTGVFYAGIRGSCSATIASLAGLVLLPHMLHIVPH